MRLLAICGSVEAMLWLLLLSKQIVYSFCSVLYHL